MKTAITIQTKKYSPWVRVYVWPAKKLAKDLGPNHTIVTILCDKSDIYRSKMFNKKFLTEKELPYPKWL